MGMKFTIELQNDFVRFRLQKDNSWRQYAGNEDLIETDFVSTDTTEISRKSNLKGQVKEINGKKYDINPNEWLTKNEQLNYESLIFRQDYPEPPKRKQLIDVIAAGDDDENNCLILNNNGILELIRPIPVDDVNNPSIIVRHEIFIAGNGYVGIEASKDQSYIDELYTSSMEHWLEHLRNHVTQNFSDTPPNRTLEQIRRELKEIRMQWRSEY